MIGVGIIGYGSIAQDHARAIGALKRTVDGSELVLVPQRREVGLAHVAAQLDLCLLRLPYLAGELRLLDGVAQLGRLARLRDRPRRPGRQMAQARRREPARPRSRREGSTCASGPGQVSSSKSCFCAEYSAIVDRPPLKLPGKARIVFWTIVNYEVWDIGRPMARQVLPAPTGVFPRVAE